MKKFFRLYWNSIKYVLAILGEFIEYLLEFVVVAIIPLVIIVFVAITLIIKVHWLLGVFIAIILIILFSGAIIMYRRY